MMTNSPNGDSGGSGGALGRGVWCKDSTFPALSRPDPLPLRHYRAAVSALRSRRPAAGRGADRGPAGRGGRGE